MSRVNSGTEAQRGDISNTGTITLGNSLKPRDVGYFDPDPDAKAIETKESKTIYHNVFSFTNQLHVKAIPENAIFLRKNLNTCLLGKADRWYTEELDHLAINVPPVLNFAAAAAGNGGDPPPTKKPIGLRAQFNKEGSGLESVGDFVVVDTSGKRRGNGLSAIAPTISAPPLAGHYRYPLCAPQPFLNSRGAHRCHENIEFNEGRRIEEMGSEASSDGKDGSGTAGEE
ncbi:hypothetical protein LPUS_04969 [Lasallia pustulata]|uniref:Uncharacterized protein n=1 Tax=Lasallia pustulata TaxID=136370 RepID=A0A1W5CY09_9LECA|nr:hypothetical protein LPUS_04969 [Lasallia pustulata]